jgi:hypothetical protein
MTQEIVVIIVIVAVVIGIVFVVLTRRDEKVTWDEFEERKLLWVPAEDWSAFGECIASLSNFRDTADLRGYTKDVPDFEWTTQPDFMGDAMWVQYVCRKPEWSHYLRVYVAKINEHSERGIRGYSGDLPTYEEEDVNSI